ncbi:MAG: ATP-dependent Clp protease proteolytic subunit [Thermoplasmata archaeon]|nr:ATP-dependent Clp protease proteolytic subunit [Candidatus Sysuiplasma acidicola]MBX8645711.1 ATP-dependent Clp protease proteolytic subunit [Candidatus Sysuiplasma acidicola]MDH2906086.1 ATP-dependent Clp protease proteolytic subunit [Methanomassiliicoccales archaeon]
MRAVLRILAVVAVFMLIFLPHPAAAQSAARADTASATAHRSVIVVNFNIAVDQGAASYVQTAASAAISNHEDMVIVMNTPGGLLENMLSIVSAIQSVQSRGLSVYTYVPPDGAAASAGSYIALATNRTYMGDGSVIGPSTPYIIGGTALEEQHVKNFSVQFIGALASRNHYNVSAAENMAENNVAYNASTAYAIGLISGEAQSFSEFLGLAGLQNATINVFQEPVFDQFLSVVSNPTLDGIFFLVGIVAIFIDMTHRTLFLTFFGGIMIALGLLGAEVIGAPVVAILILIAAAVLIFLELKAGHGIFAMSGILLGLVGSWLLAGNSLGYSPTPFGTGNYIGMGVVGALLIIGAVYISRIRKAMMDGPKLVGPHRTIGALGWAVTDVMPGSGGICNVLSEEWTCTSDKFISKGTNVKVLDYGDGKLRVEEAPPQTGKDH